MVKEGQKKLKVEEKLMEEEEEKEDDEDKWVKAVEEE